MNIFEGGIEYFEDEPEKEYKESREKIFVQLHDPRNQFTVNQLKREYPEWNTEYEGDAELTTICHERTRALRKIDKKTRVSFYLLHGGQQGLRWAIDHTPKEVGGALDAHGIAGKRDAVAELDQILKNGIDKKRAFYSMSFTNADEAAGAIGAERPFVDGGFIVVSGYNKKLLDNGIKYVVVGEEYNRVLDILKKRYPKVTFVPWNEAPGTFTAEANKTEDKNISCDKLTEENRPFYYVSEEHGF